MGSIFIFLHAFTHFSQHDFLKRQTFFIGCSWTYMWGFDAELFILFRWSVYIFMPVPYCFNYYCFVVKFEIRNSDALCLLLSQDHFNYLESFVISYKIKGSLFLCRYTNGILIGIVLHLYMALSGKVILTILNLPINGHLLIYFLQFLFYRSFHSWLNLCLGILLFFMCCENYSFLFSPLDISLLVYKNKNDFYGMLILYSATLLNLLIISNMFLIKSLGFFIYKIISSANNDNLSLSAMKSF